ncbi:MAG: ATP-binding cassette domain-containing protein [Chitinophagaceae bacterium]|nr:ATP-binding cassette domain-containing protein [Chitinophagaceae bacterium]
MPTTKSPVARILNLLRLERKEISAVYFYAILNGLIQLSLPVGVQAIIGYVLGASMRASLIVLITLVVLGVLIAGIMQINQMKIIEKIQQKLFVRYSFAFAQHIPNLDLKKNDSVYLPELINRFFDVPLLQKSLSKILLDIPTAVIQILFGLLLLSFYHPAFILFGVILVTILILILKYTGGKGLETSLQKSKFKYKVAAWLEEMARVIRSTKLAKQNDLHLQKTDEQVSNYLIARNNHFKVLLFQFNVLVIFKTLITAAMLIVGTMLMVNQQLTVGQFIAAEIVILLVLNSVEKLIINLGSVYDTLTAVEKASEITDKPIEKNGTVELSETNSGVKLEMKDVRFSYNGESDILKNISLTINSNEKVCISGKDSSGKSTLLKLMTGSYTDFNGSVLIDDVPLGNYNLASLRAQTGVLMNQQDIFQGTLLENITLGNTAITIETVKEYANKTGLTDFIASLKDGYDTILDPTGKRLARNVVHRILLVRALASQPRLLLLEEPWMNMSREHRSQILQLLIGIKNTTLVVVTNDEEFIQQCDKVIVMNENGSINI